MIVPNRRKKLTPEQKVQLVSGYIAKLPLKVLQERYGVTRQTIYRILKQTPEQL